jgi:hypothetical protein
MNSSPHENCGRKTRAKSWNQRKISYSQEGQNNSNVRYLFTVRPTLNLRVGTVHHRAKASIVILYHLNL